MISLFIFLFGLIIGSFLNAVVYRMKNGESVLKGRSHCPNCSHVLLWQDLIPVLSFVFLGGKCRYCKNPISWQYPLVEIATALLFLQIFNAQPASPAGGFPISNLQNFSLPYFWIIASFLIIIFVYDLKYYLIPDSIVYSAVGVAFLYKIFEVLSFNSWDLIGNLKFEIENLGSLENAFASAFLTSLFFLAIYLISKGRWMGFGDVKLTFFMGVFLGFPNIVVALFFAFFMGAVVGIVLIAEKKKHLRSEVPFGPFLIAGTYIALFWGQNIMNWYLQFLLV